MTIAINSASFTNTAGNDVFCENLLKMAAAQPEHGFVFIGSAIHAPVTENVHCIISSPRADNQLMWKLWLNYTLPGIARKQKADIILHINGTCSLRSRLLQLTFISDLSFLHFPQFFPKKQLHFLKKHTPAFLNKADCVVTGTDFIVKEISTCFPHIGQPVQKFYFGAADEYQPLHWKEKEAVREKYTDGKEYFLFNGDIHPRNNLLHLLKAFSFFKKRQKSNMQLIIAATRLLPGDPLAENLRTFKFRNEVVLLTHLDLQERSRIIGAAYAFVYPSLYDGLGAFVQQAMQCEVPVVTSNIPGLMEVAGDAGLYSDPSDFEDIADKMMLVFKDENLRNQLIARGQQIIQENKSHSAPDLLWQLVNKKLN